MENILDGTQWEETQQITDQLSNKFITKESESNLMVIMSMLNDSKWIWLLQNIHIALSIKEHKRTKHKAGAGVGIKGNSYCQSCKLFQK